MSDEIYECMKVEDEFIEVIIINKTDISKGEAINKAIYKLRQVA